jgi:hypothetical protein
LPTDELELAKLARSLSYADGEELLNDFRGYTARNRERFQQLFDAACSEGVPVE